MTEMERPIHVWVRKGAEPLGMFLLHLLHRVSLSEKVGIALNTGRQARRIGLEMLSLLPIGTNALFNVDEIVSFIGLYQRILGRPTFSMITTDPAFAS